MKIYSLRTLYASANIQFTNEIILRPGETQIQFISRRELPTTTYDIMSNLPDGKRELRVSTINRVYQGSPLLLEIMTSCIDADDATPFKVRPTLEAQTAKATSLMNWSWPGVVGPKLGDGLFFQKADEKTWTWYDAEPIHIMDYYESPKRLLSALEETEQKIATLPSKSQTAAETAVRWWRHSSDVKSPADRLVAFWIILEIVAFALCSANSIHGRVIELLLQVFPKLAAIENGRLIRKIEKVLSNARNRAVHCGMRDLAEPNATVLVARDVAMASIQFLLRGPVTAYPSPELLKTLGIESP